MGSVVSGFRARPLVESLNRGGEKASDPLFSRACATHFYAAPRWSRLALAMPRALPLLLAALAQAVAADNDLVRRLYQAHLDSVPSSRLAIAAKDLPQVIKDRLAKIDGAQWDQFSGLLQRAVIWDSGFVFATPTRLVQIYTSCSRTMADMHVDIAVIEGLQSNSSVCDIPRCGMNNHFLSSDCPPAKVAPLARCAVLASDMVGVPSMTGVVWAEDGQNPDVPDPVIRVHASVANGSASNLYAIHLTDEAFLGPQSCQMRGNFIVPCRDKLDSDIDLCVAEPGSTVDAWLRLVAQPEQKVFSLTAIIIVGIMAGVLLGLFGLVWYMHKNRQNFKTLYEQSPAANLISLGQKSSTLNSMDVFEAHARAEGGGGDDDTLSNDALCNRSIILKRFVSDPTIITKRIAFSQLNFLRVLSKGANGEVWLGQFESRYVAMKCLLPTKRKDVRALEQFSEEIRLASMLEHPRIVAFCGIAWHSLVNLSIVTEYMEKGDLENFLAQPAAESLTWKKEKLTLAKDIADALVYLHSLMPVVIHRDLKSKNILLDQQLRAKLSDFGLSRETSTEETMTNGVGTILWSAPEVLEGKRYDEKADIFSYGIVLSEIDTCALPYGFNKDKTRNKMKSMQIVHLVAEGKLLPTFRDDCPAELVELARSCLDLDPSKRPSAMQIVFTLRSKLYPLMNKAVSSVE